MLGKLWLKYYTQEIDVENYYACFFFACLHVYLFVCLFICLCCIIETNVLKEDLMPWELLHVKNMHVAMANVNTHC